MVSNEPDPESSISEVVLGCRWMAVPFSAGPLLLSWLTTHIVQWLIILGESVSMKRSV